MGADGYITILDADVVDANGYVPADDFNSVYLRTFLGHRIYTVYSDSEGRDLNAYRQTHSMEDYADIDAVLDEWEVWT